jgi:hypothetical protein
MEQQSPAGGHPSREKMLVMYQVVAARRQRLHELADAQWLHNFEESRGREQIHRDAKDRVAAAGLAAAFAAP